MKLLKLLGSLAVSFVAAGIGSIFTFSAIPNWYAALNKPFFSPPNWLFGPVWTLLYILIGISLYLFSQAQSSEEKTSGYWFFAIQLALNTAWSIVFFGLHAPLAAVFVIVLLLIMILLTIIAFGRQSKIAAYLLWPYLAWVTFASALNIAIVVLN